MKINAEMIDFSVFTDEVLNEYIKDISNECREIIKVLKEQSSDFWNKQKIANLFPGHYQTVSKHIDNLENKFIIVNSKIGTSNFYKLSPIGEKIYFKLEEE